MSAGEDVLNGAMDGDSVPKCRQYFHIMWRISGGRQKTIELDASTEIPFCCIYSLVVTRTEAMFKGTKV